MSNKEFDLEQFVDMFDTAMNSDNPTVQRCFNNLLMVVALAHAEDKEKHIGPLRKLVTDVRELQDRLTIIESAIKASSKQYNPIDSACRDPQWNTWTTTITAGNGYVAPSSGAYSISTN